MFYRIYETTHHAEEIAHKVYCIVSDNAYSCFLKNNKDSHGNPKEDKSTLRPGKVKVEVKDVQVVLPPLSPKRLLLSYLLRFRSKDKNRIFNLGVRQPNIFVLCISWGHN